VQRHRHVSLLLITAAVILDHAGTYTLYVT
jgi:hypothetical protein